MKFIAYLLVLRCFLGTFVLLVEEFNGLLHLFTFVSLRLVLLGLHSENLASFLSVSGNRSTFHDVFGTERPRQCYI